MRVKSLDKLRSNRGMTLVELMAVMVILSVVVMAVMSLYIPAHQSTVAQTQVSDVQSNLRLALKTMTRDLLAAGFLVQNIPIAFPDVAYGTENLDTSGTVNSSDFIIRTRSVGPGFARVSDVTSVTVGGVATLEVVSSEMLSTLSVGSKVRLFKPGSFSEVVEDPSSASDPERVYTVSSTSGTTIVLDVSTNSSLEAGDIEKETVIVRVKDSSQPPLQTIRYYLKDGALIRNVNDGYEQMLARNLDAVEFKYFPPSPPGGRYNYVTLKLIGKTRGLKNDAFSGEKTREVEASVKLRNTL